jgi:RecA-family ATPase
MPNEQERLLPVMRVGEIVPEAKNRPRWLVDQLWGASSVGVIGGAPKCSKTWLGLDMALSVATGTACLDRYAVPESGPVLIYLAEDALTVVRERVAGMARHRGLDLSRIDMHVITTPVLRLDCDTHRNRLFETAKKIQPRLLLLDPLVRLHGIDENHAGEVAELLAYFRSLQRQLDLSLLLVHHAKKNVAAGMAPGQGLRGSSDLHAFGDSNLYLRRSKDRLVLSTEHRAAPASPPVHLELIVSDAATTHLAVIGEIHAENRCSLEQQLLTALAGEVLTRGKLRERLSVKNERLGEVLESLERTGQIRRAPGGGWKRGP